MVDSLAGPSSDAINRIFSMLPIIMSSRPMVAFHQRDMTSYYCAIVTLGLRETVVELKQLKSAEQ